MNLRRPIAHDDGFGLVEAIIASMILALSASVIAGLLISTLDLARDNTQRTTAANLAASQIERVHEMRALDIPDGRTTLAATLISGTTYTVTQDAAFVPSGAETACSANGALEYKRVTVTVTWPNMGNTQPVRSDTLRALGFGPDGLSASKGAAALKVLDSGGVGVSGIAVTLYSGVTPLQTLTTDGDGCIVFTSITPGNHTARVNTVGYVNVDGVQSHQGPLFGVTASQVTLSSLTYARSGTLTTTLLPPSGYTIPAKLAVNVNTSRWSTAANRSFPDCSTAPAAPAGCVSGTSAVRAATAIFPDNYRSWAGSCLDAEPSGAVLQPVTAGAVTSVNSSLGGVRFTVGLVAAPTVYAVHALDGRCGAGEVIPLGSLAAGTTWQFALPYGTWYIRRTPATTGLPILSMVTLSATTPTATLVLPL